MQEQGYPEYAGWRDDVDERIRLDAAAHPERTHREHIEAAERIASESYREELRMQLCGRCGFRWWPLDGTRDCPECLELCE